MSRLNMLVAAVLTGFILLTTFGVVNAYRQANTSRIDQSQPISVEIPVSSYMPTNTVNTAISPHEAALVAASFLGQTDVYSVEVTTWQEEQVYKVVLSSGDVIYLSFSGEILANESPQPVIVTTSSEVPINQTYTNYDDDHDEFDDDHDHDD